MLHNGFQRATGAQRDPFARLLFRPEIDPRLAGVVIFQRPASVRILFVDDEEHIRLSEKRLLEELGFNTDTAANGQEALRMHAEKPGRYQLVITDLNMPGINGVALSERLHQRDPDLPIFLITGYHELLQGIHPAAVGIRTVLAKPFDMAELYEALKLIDAV